jgi:hypothetical protein
VVLAIALLLLSGAVVGAMGGGKSDDDVAGGGKVTSDTVSSKSGDSSLSSGNGASISSTTAPAYARESATATGSAQVAGMAAGGGTGASGTDEVASVVTGAQPQSQPSAIPGAADRQKIVKNATISVQVKKGDFRHAFDSAATTAGAHGGFVVSSDSSTEKDKTSFGVLVLRVPSDAFDAVRADLVRLGTVKDEHLTGADVGGQIVDLDARIRSLQLQEDALRQLMAKARTIGETIEVQNQLTQVRQQIEQLSGEKARLVDAAALATIRVELAEPGAAVPSQPKPKHEAGTIRHALTTAVDGAETVVAGTIIVLGWLVPISLLALLLWLGARPFRRRAPAAL